jgi:hypothetical protein
VNEDPRIAPPSTESRLAAFLVESYTPDPVAAVRTAGRTAQAAADELSSPGHTVRYRGSIAVPADEQAFHLFEGTDERLVRDVCGRAGIPCDRLVEALADGP